MTERYSSEDTNVAVAEPLDAVVPEKPAPAMRTASRWSAKGSLAILDQALISGSNFLVGIFLARWLAPAQYGAYALGFSVFLLLTFLYQSLLLEPMSVFSGSAYRKSLRGYLGALLWIHFSLTAVGIVVLGTATLVAYKWGMPDLPGALLGVTLGSPC